MKKPDGVALRSSEGVAEGVIQVSVRAKKNDNGTTFRRPNWAVAVAE